MTESETESETETGSESESEPESGSGDGWPSRRHLLALFAMIGAFALLTGWLAFARYHSLHHRTFDLALYTRMAWGLAHGQLWEPIVGGSFLGGHVPWVLLPLGLLGTLFGTAETLLVVQSVLVGAAAWPLARIARRHIGPGAALVVAAAWLLYPNLGHVTAYEFHPGNLALLPMAHALDALDRGDGRALLWGCLLVLACRVSLALQTVVIGLLALRAAPLAMRRSGALVALVSVAYFALSLLWLRPTFGGAVTGSLALHFGHWGGSPFGVLPLLLSEPARVLEHFAVPGRLLYPLLVLAPLALLPLMRPSLLWVAAPPLALNLLSQFPTANQLYSHYLTPALPPLFVGAVLALSARPPRACRSGLLALAAATLIGSWQLGGLPWSRDFPAADFRDDRRSAEHRALLRAIDADSSVQAPDALLPHLAERVAVHRAPPPERETELVVLDLSHRRRFAARESQLRTVEEPSARAWLARADHGVVVARGDLALLQRGADPRGGVASRYLREVPYATPGTPITACLEVIFGHVEERRLVLELRARGPCPSDLAIRLGTGERPSRVDLLFDGLLSPAHLRAGDSLRSIHAISSVEAAAIRSSGLRVGALRSSGARPAAGDPVAVPVRSASPPTAHPVR